MSTGTTPTLRPSTPVPKTSSSSGNTASSSGNSVNMSKEPTLEPKDPHVVDVAHSEHPLAKLSQTRKNWLLFCFSLATFLDICNVAGIALAVPYIRADLDLEVNQVAWIITSYSLCFAAFILFAGRLADMFPATIIFNVGFTGLGVISLVTSFVTTNKYGFLILRGLGGLMGALTIPSSYHLLIHMFPESSEQQKKLSLLGMAGGLGNVLGLVIAGLTMKASYHWFFRVIAILCFVFSASAIAVLPKISAPPSLDSSPRWKRLDLPGVLLMMGFLVCFILGLTNGPIDGWGSAAFIAPFVISFASAIGFFVWEYMIPARTALLPASVYQIRNFIPSSLAVMIPLGFWFTSQLYYATYFQVVFGWSPLLVSAALLPQGIIGLVIGAASQFVPQIVGKPQFSIPIGVLLIVIAEILQIYSYGGAGNDYWRLVFPAYILGSAGAMITYFGSAVSVLIYAPPEMSGVISGMSVFTYAHQLARMFADDTAWVQVVAQVGGAVALAVQAAFEQEDLNDWMLSAGRTFWFILAWSVSLGAIYVISWRQPGTPAEEHELARQRIAATGRGEGVVEV